MRYLAGEAGIRQFLDVGIGLPTENNTHEVAQAYERLNERMGATQGTLRSHGEVARFFDGLEMVEPGLVQLHRWRPEPGEPGLEFDVPAYAGVGRKP